MTDGSFKIVSNWAVLDSDDAGTQTHTRITAVVFGEKTTRAKLPRALRPPRRPHARIARPRPHAAQADAVAKLWPGLHDSFADAENKWKNKGWIGLVPRPAAVATISNRHIQSDATLWIQYSKVFRLPSVSLPLQEISRGQTVGVSDPEPVFSSSVKFFSLESY